MEAELRGKCLVILLVIGLIGSLCGCTREVMDPFNPRNDNSKGYNAPEESVAKITEPYHLENTTDYLDERFFTSFLVVRDDGLIHAEAALTKDDLLECLQIWLSDEEKMIRASERMEAAMEEAADGAGGMAEAEGISAKVLQAALADLPEAASLERVLKSQGITDFSESLDRETFARVMVETFKLSDYSIRFDVIKELPRDLDTDNEALILATQQYRVELSEKQRVKAFSRNNSESKVIEAFLNAVWPEGFSFLRGHLYYANENGALMRNGKLGAHLYFGADGRQTSGDVELDQAVVEKIAEYIEANPKGDRYKWLRTAFFDVVRNIWYYPGMHPDFGDNCDEEWMTPFAITGLETWRGDCYVYAASFTALARGLGYDAHAISGIALDAPAGPHSWTIIKIDPKNPLDIIPGSDATDYFYDPQMAAHIRSGLIGEGTDDEYMFAYNIKNAYLWEYQWTEPSETCYE